MTTIENELPTTIKPSTEKLMESFAPSTPSTEELVKGFENKVPSLWTILPTEEEGVIMASSSSTQEVFEGTVEEFNARLK